MAGTIVADTIQDGAGNSTSMDNAIYGSAKAWVNFSATGGTITVNSSYNVSSVTYTSTGQYTTNFTNAFADTKYNWIGSVGYNNLTSTAWAASPPSVAQSTWKTTTSLRLCATYANNTVAGSNADDFSVSVLR